MGVRKFWPRHVKGDRVLPIYPMIDCVAPALCDAAKGWTGAVRRSEAEERERRKGAGALSSRRSTMAGKNKKRREHGEGRGTRSGDHS